MLGDAGHQGVEFLPLGRVVQRGWRKKPVLEQGPQAVALDQIEVLLRAPHQVEAAVGHLLGHGIGHGGARPVGDDRRADLPRRAGRPGRIGAPRRRGRGEHRQERHRNQSLSAEASHGAFLRSGLFIRPRGRF